MVMPATQTTTLRKPARTGVRASRKRVTTLQLPACCAPQVRSICIHSGPGQLRLWVGPPRVSALRPRGGTAMAECVTVPEPKTAGPAGLPGGCFLHPPSVSNETRSLRRGVQR